jgi:hypothetical protein
MGVQLNTVLVRGTINPPVKIEDNKDYSFFSNTVKVRKNSFDLFLVHYVHSILSNIEKFRQHIIFKTNSNQNLKLKHVRVVNCQYSCQLPYTRTTIISKFLIPLLEKFEHTTVGAVQEASTPAIKTTLQNLLKNPQFISVNVHFTFGTLLNFQHSKCKTFMHVTLITNNHYTETATLLDILNSHSQH